MDRRVKHQRAGRACYGLSFSRRKRAVDRSRDSYKGWSTGRDFVSAVYQLASVNVRCRGNPFVGITMNMMSKLH